MSDPIVSFDEAAMRGELKELVRRTVEDTLNALLEEEADDLIGADRYERTAGREAYRARPLRARAHHHLGPGDPQDAQAQGNAVRHRHHRAVQAPGGLRRGGHDRDVPGRGLHEAHRGRLRDPVGRERVGGHRVELERESVRGRRGMEEQAVGPRVPLRLRRRASTSRGAGAAPSRTWP